MTESEMRRWGEKDFAYRYLEDADIRILDRRRMLDLLGSFYSHFLGDRKGSKVLDLGCGDGILTHQLLQVDDALSATLIDGSADMLHRARERLADFKTITYINTTFQGLLSGDIQLPEFDIAVSSLAIHHLASSERDSLFRFIRSHLINGGYFINIDIAISPSEAIEEWYVKLWRQWMIERETELNIESACDRVIDSCYAGEHYSRLSTLAAQLDALRDAGFRDTDCFYKHGIFAMYGGRK